MGVTVAAGSGTVSFGAQVGGTKSLASLDVTGSLIKLGGDVTTLGTQTYTGAVVLVMSATGVLLTYQRQMTAWAAPRSVRGMERAAI